MVANLNFVLHSLAEKRPTFHSEADFQHALAWALREAEPTSAVRLEYRPPQLDKTYLDIWLSTATVPHAIELKYVTRRLAAEVAGERFDLNNHGAQDLRRYDFIKDIRRLERVVETFAGAAATAIFLTNDALYWQPVRSSDSIDAAFRIHEGRTLNGELAWSATAGPGTMKNREEPFALRGSYSAQWRDYSDLGGPAGRFRYLLFAISPERAVQDN